MKKIYLPLLLILGMVFQLEAQNKTKQKPENIRDWVKLGLNSQNLFKSATDGIRNWEAPLADTLILSFKNDEFSDFEPEGTFFFEYEENEGALRMSKVIVDADFEGTPIPINSVEGNINYDAQGRYIGVTINAVTLFGPIPIATFTVRYDDKGRVILSKEEESPLFGGDVFGDSIVYVDGVSGLPISVFAFELGLHSEEEPHFESFTEMEYNNQGQLISYVRTVENSFESIRERYSDVEFYVWRDSYLEYLSPMEANFTFDIFGGLDNNPLNRFERYVISGTHEIWEDGEWVVLANISYNRNDELLAVTLEYPGDYKEINEYRFNNGKLISHLVLIDIMIGDVIPETRILLDYDDNGDFVSEVSQWIDFGEWLDQDKITYTYLYDDMGRLIQMTQEFFFEEFYLFGERYEMTLVDDIETSIQDNLNHSELIVAPNPLQDELFIQLPGFTSEHILFQVFNLQGQTVHAARVWFTEGQTHSLHLGHLPSGTYILNVTSGNNQLSKLVIKR